MSKNIGSVMTFFGNNNNQIPLYPLTTCSQVEDMNFGEEFGPFTLVLKANGWVNKQQTLDLPGITEKDIPYCIKVLKGTVPEMKAQDAGYTLIDPFKGIESLDGQVRFTLRDRTNKTPKVDITVQITWNR